MKYSISDYASGECSKSDYFDQYNPIRLELNKIYTQHKGSWNEKHFKIIFIDGNVACGVSVYDAIGNKYIGEYSLFNLDNGFTYNDLRAAYRLQEEI